MRIDELIDGLIDPNAVEESKNWPKATTSTSKRTKPKKTTTMKATAAAPSPPSLIKMKAEALERFANLRSLYEKWPQPSRRRATRTRLTSSSRSRSPTS